MVLSLENACEVLHNSLPKLLLSATLLSSINLKGMKVAIVAVGKYPYLVSVFTMLCVHKCIHVHSMCTWCVFRVYVCTDVCLRYLCAHMCLGYVCACEHNMCMYSGHVSMYVFRVYLFIICTVGIHLSMCVYVQPECIHCSLYHIP